MEQSGQLRKELVKKTMMFHILKSEITDQIMKILHESRNEEEAERQNIAHPNCCHPQTCQTPKLHPPFTSINLVDSVLKNASQTC